jgi:hypothetical protein
MRKTITIIAALALAAAETQAKRPSAKQMPPRSAAPAKHIAQKDNYGDGEAVADAGPESICHDLEKFVFVHYAPIDAESGMSMDIKAKENWGRQLWIGTYTCDFDNMIPDGGRHYGRYATAQNPYGEVSEEADPNSKKFRDIHKCSVPTRTGDGGYKLMQIADTGEKFTISCDAETNRVTLKGPKGKAVVQY